MAGPSVICAGVNHFYGRGALRKQILHDIHTEIDEGEIVIVTGPSGSGKTTLLTLVGALRSTQEGSVRVLGEELNGARPRLLESVRRRIGFIFQQHNLLEAITARENVELGVRVTRRFDRTAVRRRSQEMLEAVGLAERMEYRPEQLSGGQRQRVAIARALASEPAMLLADEPTASLDRESGREVVERMKALAQHQGTTILMVTHDNRILDVADRIIHLEDGHLSTFSESVLANNQHMMGLLAEARQKEDLRAHIDGLDEEQFHALLISMSEEVQQFLTVTSLATDRVFESMLEQGLMAFTRKLASIIGAERASLFLVDRASETLVLRVTQDLPVEDDIRIPLDSGIAGAAVAARAPVFVPDAYADPRFNPEIDRRFGYQTRSILTLPLFNRDGEIFGVAQLLNRLDGEPFETSDADRVSEFLSSIGIILEGLQVQAPLARREQAHG